MSDKKQMDCYYASGITPTEAARQAEGGIPVQRVVRVRSRIMLRAYANVVNSIAHLNDEERRRVMKAANITCGEAP